MLNIHFNSWSSKNKKPFGAIKVGSEVSFSIDVKGDLDYYIELVMYKDGHQKPARYPLKKVSNDIYLTKVKIETSGLYFYHFKINYTEDGVLKECYYGTREDNFGGIGRLVDFNVTSYQLTCYEEKTPSPDWYRKGIFYQIFPDRFNNGESSGKVLGKKKNSFIYATDEDEPMYIKNKQGEVVRWDFFGGNLLGITKKIPYLKKMGISGIYLNPIFEATSNHRYDTNDFMKIDPMLGTKEDFLNLLETLHKNDMHLILDGVFNHVGKDSRYFNASKLYGSDVGATQEKDSPYYPWFKFSDYPNDYASWWGIKDLPEVDKENLEYQKFIYLNKDSVINTWTELGVDGWRLDVADELTDGFIYGIRKVLDKYPQKILLGEVWEDASNKVAHHQRREYVQGYELQGVMNYPLRRCILDMLSDDNQRSLEQISRQLMSLRENYPKDFYLNSFNNIGTHDTRRILTALDNNIDKVKAAFSLMFFLPGVPCIYYGDEVGLTGGKDPKNRAFYPWNNQNTEIKQHTSNLAKFYQKNEVLSSGEITLLVGKDLFIIVRYDEQNTVYFAINLSDKVGNFKKDFLGFHDEQNFTEKVKKVFKDTLLQPYECTWKKI